MIDDKLEGNQKLGLIDKAKVWLYKNLKNHAFIVVTLFASIPNPLFDLAGLTCGHFLVPFGVFFGATFIGKAIIKVSIQCIFVIVSFSEHHVEHILSYLEELLPPLRGFLTTAIEK